MRVLTLRSCATGSRECFLCVKCPHLQVRYSTPIWRFGQYGVFGVILGNVSNIWNIGRWEYILVGLKKLSYVQNITSYEL
jgi:hypothetical protein